MCQSAEYLRAFLRSSNVILESFWIGLLSGTS
jgi:hypothetical protein